MDVAVIANRFEPSTGYVGERLGELGANFRNFWLNKPDTLHDVEKQADLLLFPATGWRVTDEAWSREIEAQKALVRRALDRGVPMFAICSGAQVVASVLGATIVPCRRPEIGWVSIDTEDPALCASGQWFAIHRDSWIESSLPDGATPIGRSDVCPHAFRYERTMSVLFHPEATIDMIDRWISEAPEWVAAGLDDDEVRAQTREFADSARRRGRDLIDGFLERVVGASIGGGASSEGPPDQAID